MSAKEIVQKFYTSDLLIHNENLKEFLHPEMTLDWNNTEGFVQLDYNSLHDLFSQLAKAYVWSKVRISHIIAENDLVSVRYSHFVKTIENPTEEMLLAHFATIWQIKDDKLFRGYQISQL